MNFQIILVCLVVSFIIVSLYKELMKPVIVFVVAIIFLLTFGVLSPKDALQGFANEQIAVIFLLVVLSEIIKKTGVLDLSLNKIFKPTLSYKQFLTRMTFSVAGVSAFVNNTPLVAILLPYVYNWAKKKGISPSKVLIPLSYATIIGGTATLIGTSTNLVVNALATEASIKNPAIVPLGIFDFSYVGVPLIFLGGLYIIFYSHRLLPSRKDPLDDFEEKSGDYIVETVVPVNSEFIGKTVENNLRNLRSLFLVEILRKDQHIAPVNPQELIYQDDILIFAGATETIIDLLANPNRLNLPHFTTVPDHDRTAVIEVVISANSSLNGKQVRDSSFRGNYDAAIVAVKRDGEKLSGSIGEIILKSGDLLLIIAGVDFKDRIKLSNDFYVISNIRELRKISPIKTTLIITSTLAAFLISAFGGISLFVSLLLPISLIGLMRVIKFDDLKNGVDIDMFIILALALAIGKSISNSGADDLFAGWIINLLEPFHSPMAALAGIYIITNIFSMIITNKASVAITFPIAMAMVEKLRLTTDPGLSYTPFILAIAYAGCAEFITPFGYQTNLMVYGPGGYKFKDYVKIGAPLTILFMVTAIIILGYIYKLY